MEDAGYVDRDGVVLRWAREGSGISMLVVGSDPPHDVVEWAAPSDLDTTACWPQGPPIAKKTAGARATARGARARQREGVSCPRSSRRSPRVNTSGGTVAWDSPSMMSTGGALRSSA